MYKRTSATRTRTSPLCAHAYISIVRLTHTLVPLLERNLSGKHCNVLLMSNYTPPPPPKKTKKWKFKHNGFNFWSKWIMHIHIKEPVTSEPNDFKWHSNGLLMCVHERTACETLSHLFQSIEEEAEGAIPGLLLMGSPLSAPSDSEGQNMTPWRPSSTDLLSGPKVNTSFHHVWQEVNQHLMTGLWLHTAGYQSSAGKTNWTLHRPKEELSLRNNEKDKARTKNSENSSMRWHSRKPSCTSSLKSFIFMGVPCFYIYRTTKSEEKAKGKQEIPPTSPKSEPVSQQQITIFFNFP